MIDPNPLSHSERGILRALYRSHDKGFRLSLNALRVAAHLTARGTRLVVDRLAQRGFVVRCNNGAEAELTVAGAFRVQEARR